MNNHKLVELISLENWLYHGSIHGDEYVNGIVITKINNLMINDDLIKEMMFYLYKRHPLFRAHIYKDEVTGKVFFAIPVEYEKTANEMKYERRQVSSKVKLIHDIEEFSCQPLDYESSCILWRLGLFEYEEDGDLNCAFVLIVPMYMTDGINITVLCIELVNILNSLLKGETCCEMIEQLDLIDNVHIIAEKSNLINENVCKKYEQYYKNENEVLFNLPNKLMNCEDFGVKINLLKFNTSFTRKIVSFAKLNGIKINGLLTCAMFYAFKELFEENKIFMQKDVSIFIPVNLRFRAVPNIDFSHARACVTACNLNLFYPNFGKYENIIDEAKYVDQVLAEHIENGSIYSFFIDEKFSHFPDLYKNSNLKSIYKLIDSERNCDIVFSNTGTYASKKKVISGPIEIHELYFGDSLKCNPSQHNPFMLHCHTFNDQLMFQLTTNRTKIHTNHSDRYMELFERHLMKVVSEK